VAYFWAILYLLASATLYNQSNKLYYRAPKSWPENWPT